MKTAAAAVVGTRDNKTINDDDFGSFVYAYWVTNAR
jgi:hypothetical protein